MKCVDKTSLQECAVKVINKTKLTEVRGVQGVPCRKKRG